MLALREHFASRQHEVLALTCALVEAESPSGDKEGSSGVVSLLASAANSIPSVNSVERFASEDFGEHLAVRAFAKSDSSRSVLVLGHTDTVHPRGSIKERPWRAVGNRIYGPGIFDMKVNCAVALEALRATKNLVADKPGAKDLNWQAAIDFVSRCQNLPSHNKEKWASGDPANKGGFIYYPGSSNAGEVTLEGGGKALRSYGSMSYAGLLSFIYADVKKDDPRVVAAVEWLNRNYSLAENPGLEQQGYFYYLHLMAKGLTAAGITEFEIGGKKVDWRRDLAMRLMKLQQQDGSWTNETPRWKENNPVLVTTYCALTLEILYGQL